MRRSLLIVVALLLPLVARAQSPHDVPLQRPAAAAEKGAASIAAARSQRAHLWRDTRPWNDDGTLNAYVEIGRGDLRKWEYDMRANRRTIDRMIPKSVGGYPINYGFVPQTISYDGDPFDALVLGPALRGGEMVRGVVVGLLLMEDEKGLDSKVVLSGVDAAGRPLHELTDDVRREVGDYFNRYKAHEANAWSKVLGWGSVEEAKTYVERTHAFFRNAR